MPGPTSRITIVTGAGGALGRAIVQQLLGGGATVVAVDRSDEALEAVPAGAERETANLTDPDDVDALFGRVESRLGRPWSVVNAVGGFRAGEAAESPPDDYRTMLGLNLDTSWWTCRAAAGRMRRAGGGAIVLVAARNGLEAIAGAAAYSVSKGAVVHLTRVLDAELRTSGIRVNAIVPGLIDTPANRAVMSAAVMERAVAPAAVAKVVEFLVSDAAAPIVGAVIPVYGAF